MTTTSLRCAIYTRKSSEEGLDQDFNSLEAQREACEAYIRSQAHERWKLLPDAFDDGGFSGGNLDRPGLARLMEAVRDGKVDVIVIYKIDRLTRSLTDFARLAETFDKHGVSFVSVTQQFNTTTSMGRLMLNVLLSFAQFEREITGERIRDKIAASKKKGMWMGGNVPMGYGVRDRQLIVNESEAATIRNIFELYLEERTLPRLLGRLHREGIRTAVRQSAKGKPSGDLNFTRGHLYKLLSNPIYVGIIRHKGADHRGQHEAIVDHSVWERVQAQLAANTQGQSGWHVQSRAATHLLLGRLFSAAGNRLILSHARKGQRRYDYYVEQGRPRDTSDANAGRPQSRPVLRFPAGELDRVVAHALVDLLRDPLKLTNILGDLDPAPLGRVVGAAAALAKRIEARPTGETTALLLRVEIGDGQLDLTIDTRSIGTAATSGKADPGGLALRSVRMPLAIRNRGRQTRVPGSPPGTH